MSFSDRLQIHVSRRLENRTGNIQSSVGQMASPTFKDGLATDYVTDAVLKSAKTLRWEKVKKVK
ncbi:hypothetical protein D3C83_121770 [compost metagenome]